MIHSNKVLINLTPQLESAWLGICFCLQFKTILKYFYSTCNTFEVFPIQDIYYNVYNISLIRPIFAFLPFVAQKCPVTGEESLFMCANNFQITQQLRYYESLASCCFAVKERNRSSVFVITRALIHPIILISFEKCKYSTQAQSASLRLP